MILSIAPSLIWRYPPAQLRQEVKFLLEHPDHDIKLDWTNGPALAFGKEMGKYIRRQMLLLTDKQIASRIRTNASHLGAILNGRRPLSVQLLLALLNQVHLYRATLPSHLQPQDESVKLPEFPLGAAHRRHSFMNAMQTARAIQLKRNLAANGKRHTTVSGQPLSCLQFEILDSMLRNYEPEWLRFCRLYDGREAGLALRTDGALMALVCACLQTAAKSPQQPTLDKDSLAVFLAESPPYAAFEKICQMFHDWQDAWKATTAFVAELKL